MFFGIASLWGFLIGTGSILAGLALAGTPFRPAGLAWALLLAAALLAPVGGAVAAAAYREVMSRRSR